MKTIISQRSVQFLNKSIANQATATNSSLAMAVQQLSLGNFNPLENYLREKLLLIDDQEMRAEVITNFFNKVENLINTLRHKAAMEHDIFEIENMEKASVYLPILKKKFIR
ncbi:MAG: hypothetical protein ACK4EX_08195 [Thermaurantimonas sp.]|uniref:hypothetical protein n=1 Tax=Thermaurantimonas sp. TaxID=2681568 RepID=UPI003919EF1D